MDDRIEEVVKRSSEPLKDDWTLEQEVAQELRTHLVGQMAPSWKGRGLRRKRA